MVPPLVCPPDGLPPLGVDRGRNHLHTIAGVILGGTLGVLILRAGGNALAFDLLFLAGWLVATALHEFGHATAAYARGFRVISIVIGPVFVTRAARKGFRLGVRPALLGGWVLSAPRRWDGDRRYLRDKAWVVAAGPAVSLVVGVVGLLLSRPWTVLWEWSVISLVIGVVTLIPARYPTGRTSDGEKLQRLREAGPADLAFMALRGMLVSMRPRDWDQVLVDVARAESESQGSEAIDATLFLYYRLLDSGDTVAAGALLQRLIDYTCGRAGGRERRSQERSLSRPACSRRCGAAISRRRATGWPALRSRRSAGQPHRSRTCSPNSSGSARSATARRASGSVVQVRVEQVPVEQEPEEEDAGEGEQRVPDLRPDPAPAVAPGADALVDRDQ